MTRPDTARAGRRGRPNIDVAARREELLDAAERVIARGATDPSISDIAAEAGYARTVVYAAFPSLAAVAYALTVRHTGRLVEQINGILAQPRPLEELLHATIDVLCEFVEKNPQLYPLLMQTWVGPGDATSRPLFRGIVDWATQMMTRILSSVGAETSRARPWACSVAGAALLAAEDWSDRRDCPRAELVDAIMAALMPGLAAVGADRLTGPIAPA